MDPDANWEEQQRLIVLGAQRDKYDNARLRELRLALGNWLRRGGFAPAAWGGKRTPPRPTNRAAGLSPRPRRIQNQEGLSFEEWFRAATAFDKHAVDRNIARVAWGRGEDPTEYAARSRRSNRATGSGLPSQSLPYRTRLQKLHVLAASPYESSTREAARTEILRLKESVHLPKLQAGYSRSEAADALQYLADQLHTLGSHQTVENWVQRVRRDGFWPLIVSTADKFAKNATHSPRNRAIYRRAHSIMLRIRDGHTVRQHEQEVELWRDQSRSWAGH